jgi:hypothetical protein
MRGQLAGARTMTPVYEESIRAEFTHQTRTGCVAASAELIDRLLERLSEGSGCFRVFERDEGRRLALVNSLTRWRRP